jgi:hypothetical protein
MPDEFYPHHANLSRAHREFVESQLRDKALPTSAVCTSTLELGIDIEMVESVAQRDRNVCFCSTARSGFANIATERAKKNDVLSRCRVSSRMMMPCLLDVNPASTLDGNHEGHQKNVSPAPGLYRKT